MNVVAGLFAFVADHRRLDGEIVQTAKAEAVQCGADGGARDAETVGDGLACKRSCRSRSIAVRVSATRPRPDGRRASVMKHPRAPRADPRRRSGVGDAPALGDNTAHKKDSTMDGHTGMLMDLHPGAPVKAGWLRNPSFTPKPRMNNLYSVDS